MVYGLSGLVEIKSIKYSWKVATRAAFLSEKEKMMNNIGLICFFIIIIVWQNNVVLVKMCRFIKIKWRCFGF